MNSRALTGVLMLSAAAGLAWAWLNGHLDAAIAKATSAASGTVKPTTTTTGRGGLGRGNRES